MEKDTKFMEPAVRQEESKIPKIKSLCLLIVDYVCVWGRLTYNGLVYHPKGVVDLSANLF